jgi:mRNA interferase RelE/StbE
MPDYQIFISKTAQKQLDELPDPITEKLITYIWQLSKNPRPSGYKKLEGREAYRIRKGDYRIIYEIIDKLLVIDIIAVGQRQHIYKKR